ncbi:MAG: FtsW/RodA/SpoVE family cell cycle protein [Lentisphaeria bacterium]|nr:FtsW/RodA/SpoVE family cell cycle protein [Lentisphaeria bacterium]
MKQFRNSFPEELTMPSAPPNTIGMAAGLILMTMILAAFGLTMLYSASSSNVAAAAAYFRNQLLWMIVGGAAGLAAFLGGFSFFCRKSILWLGACVLLLIWARFSREINGAHRWIIVGSFRLQPSELAKIAVALFVANYCSEYLRTFNDITRWKYGIWGIGAGVGAITLLILWGDDMGTSVLVAAMAFFTMFAGNLKWRYFLIPMIVLPLAVIYIKYFDAMRWGRMTIFMDPEANQRAGGYQLWNSLMALGSGSWHGLGLTNSRLKASYLPEAHTDFIIAIIGEELGYLGVMMVIICYALWGFFAFRIVMSARNRMGMLLGCALTIGVLFQAIINLGVVSGMFPTKGMPAPFISYGGSNMVCSLIATGFLVSVAMDAWEPDYPEKLWQQFKRFFSLKR